MAKWLAWSCETPGLLAMFTDQRYSDREVFFVENVGETLQGHLARLLIKDSAVAGYGVRKESPPGWQRCAEPPMVGPLPLVAQRLP